ncbi:hypothetical protein SCD_n00568 [Sulfuricella denitrificans skB26]|uniref:Transmembrane protein n=1 Tax=Sulfuricella denitrificans (strain DSM 22764 / NBRC 105220 / skB26) TaxID=1163617 RepID=S6A9N4_SULDS|nr:hypothetical protein [Sulfuricella denitrificans]BAN34415.1 hypothetical protein SCD_n00568 [Sulfuricella denitrificans skB26]
MAQNTTNPKPDQAKGKNIPAKRSFIKDDFPLIRKALIVLIASLLLSTALVIAGRTILAKQQDDMAQTQGQRNDANNKRRQAENDKQEIQDYQPKFVSLRERGFVGEERRLDWIEHIQHIRESRKLLPITYEISAQQVFQVGQEVPIGDLELRGSKMTFQMKLLHEGDLLNFLDDLKHKGFYTAQECLVKRAGLEPESAYLPLIAECSIYWLTLGEQAVSPEQIPQ